jgi:hypothetical protein
MSSRAKKKRLWREEKERRYQAGIDWYNNVIHDLNEIKKAKEEGRGIETIEWHNEVLKELDKSTVGKLCE